MLFSPGEWGADIERMPGETSVDPPVSAGGFERCVLLEAVGELTRRGCVLEISVYTVSWLRRLSIFIMGRLMR